MGYLTETPEGVILSVRAQPRSSRSGLDGLLGDAVKVRIRCAPVDGKANKELVETLAEAFDLPKSAVQFKSGETSKAKRILLRGIGVEQVKGVVEGKSKSEK
ncbi:MAG: YggU family protein [bacterium]|nr:YggU family protein [Candidatus Colisoma equi]